MRRYLFSNMLNVRDLGGYPTRTGECTKYGRIIRSDVPLDLTSKDITRLQEMSITTIVDLRSDAEILRRPSALRDVHEFEYHHCVMYGNGEVSKRQEDVPISYFEMIDEQKSMKKMLTLIAHAKQGVLYHCTAGKDRTGVLSAVLLMIVGVSRYDIFADYLISGAYLREFVKNAERDDPEFAKIITPKVIYIEKFMDMFIEKYKSVEGYCKIIGLTDEEVEMIRDKLLKE